MPPKSENSKTIRIIFASEDRRAVVEDGSVPQHSVLSN